MYIFFASSSFIPHLPSAGGDSALHLNLNYLVALSVVEVC
ncbi:hypothetical protein HG1285_17185 [Hydrogenivirga sp. 128-5-R1-1]|nr:hypothetical protein HG1285_17185 [Hydrogenivirga sp. 128-5-R1-1]